MRLASLLIVAALTFSFAEAKGLKPHPHPPSKPRNSVPEKISVR